MKNTNHWSAKDLLQISGSYWQACTLHAGVKLNVFTLLGNDKITAEELAKKLDCGIRGITVLLNALAAMKLITKKHIKATSIFANTTASKSLLSKDSQHYIGYMIMHHHHLVNPWSQLDQSIKTGKLIRDQKIVNTNKERESFLMGMFNTAMNTAPQLAEEIDLSENRSLLDLGGGPGTYAIHFCLKNPSLKATVYDLPTTKPYAEKTIASFGLSDRINFISNNYLENNISGSYDVAWLSHILHGQGPENCQVIIDKTVSSLSDRGLLLIHDFILNDTLDEPLYPAIFSLNMLINTEYGRSYSEEQIKNMLIRAGVSNIQRLSYQGYNNASIIAGRVTT